MTKKIVIIDDEESFCNLLKSMINEFSDASVEVFTSGRAALDHIEKEKADAVFVDMLMPENDGGSVIKSIREQGGPLPLIVMVTGMIAEDEIANINFPVLAKPVNKDSLKKILERLDS